MNNVSLIDFNKVANAELLKINYHNITLNIDNTEVGCTKGAYNKILETKRANDTLLLAVETLESGEKWVKMVYLTFDPA